MTFTFPGGATTSGGSGSVSEQALGNLGATATLTLTTQNTIASARLTANCALTISGLVAGSQGTIGVQQDGTGSRTLTINGSAVTLPAAANAFGSVQFWSVDGTNLYVQGAPQTGAQGPTGPTGPTGATGPAGPAGGRSEVQNAALGFFAPSFDLATAFRNITPVGGQMNGSLVSIQAGEVITSLVFMVATAAQGAVPTGVYAALYSTSGTQLAVSTNLAAGAAWGTAGPKTLAFSSPYTVASTQAAYACLLTVGSWATVQPQISSGAAQGTYLSNALSGSASYAVLVGSLSSPPSPATFTNYGVNMIWVACK